MALRVSWWGEAVEDCPVGSSGVEQGSDSVVLEPAESECRAFHAFDQIVHGYLEQSG